MLHAEKTKQQTIKDFGEQWTAYTENDGHYGSPQMFADIVEPLVSPPDFSGKTVAEIGSGAGRIVSMLIDAGANHVFAIEPSKAIEVLRANTKKYGEKVQCLEITGDQIPSGLNLDFVLSIGVIHHIPDPAPVIEACFNALRPGGKLLIWLYGREGNRLYLAVILPMRYITKYLPDKLLSLFVYFIHMPLTTYIKLCRRFNLPMRGYMLNVIGKLSPDKQRLVIFDQLNPAYAKYYSELEAVSLLRDHGFDKVEVHRRHGYSHTVVGTKPRG